MSDAAPPTDGDTALLLAVAEAEPVVGRLRMAHDAVAADGIPAHVTVLYPFVPHGRLTNDVRQSIADLASGTPAFDYRFEGVGRFGDTTVYLAPEPAGAFAGLTDAAHARWPEQPPYGGAFDIVIPHLTVGDGLDGPRADALEAAVGQVLARHGPIVGRATQITLMAEGADGQWSVDSRYPLAAGR
jgi:hypothetical protein